VATFGQKLRQAREAKNITLAEISATTKISTRALQALEWERFEQLPGGIFNKGFVRAYARCVGLNEDETVAAYLEASKASSQETDLKALAAQVEASRPRNRMGLPGAATVVAVLAVLVAVAMGGLWLREHRKEAREAAAGQAQKEAAAQAEANRAAVAKWNEMNAAKNSAVTANAATTADPGATPAPDAAKDAAAPKTAAAPAVTAPASADGGVEIVVKASSRAWVSVLRDDRPAETITLDPKDPETTSRTFKAKDRVKLILGNSGGVSVTWNGKPVTDLGKKGERSTITFTPKGMQKD
jgi:cytoskeleton protein RodZ